MDELLKWAITLDAREVTLVGLLLTFIIAAAIALNREYVVTGVRWRADQDADAKRDQALAECNTAVKKLSEEFTEARIEIVRLRAEREYGYGARSSPPSRKRGADA